MYISGKVEEYYDNYAYTATFLYDFTAESDVTLLKNKSELFKTLVAYIMRSEVELQELKLRLTNIRLDRAVENTSEIVKSFFY